MARLLIVVCIALVALESTNAALPSLKEIVQKEKDRLNSFANATFSQVQHVLAEIETTVHDKAVAELTKVKSAIDDFKQKIHLQAQDIVEKAEAEGKAVKSCVEQFGNGIEALKNKGEDAIGCIINPIAQIKNITEELTHAALSINATVADGQSQLEDCKKTGGVFEQTACQIGVGGKLLSEVVQVTTKVSNLIAQASSLVTGLPTSFSNCEKNVWSDSMLLAANNMSNLTLCLKAL